MREKKKRGILLIIKEIEGVFLIILKLLKVSRLDGPTKKKKKLIICYLALEQKEKKEKGKTFHFFFSL